MISVRPFVFAVFLGLAATPAFAVEAKPGAVQPLGVFSSVKATEDHTYGHEVRLWRAGTRLVGQLTWWDANPEGQRGSFDDGAFDPRTGEVRFGVTVVRHDVQPNVRSRAAFRGRLEKSVLAGDLKWEGKEAESRGKAGVEKLSLPLEKGERLKPFPDVDAWRKAAARAPDTVFIEELTWTEVRDAIKAGKTTIIFPTGGTEQNGPHMVLGKHNFIVKHAAERIARRLGNALVAPVLAYVPEGNLDPPTGHMQYPGTITLPDEVFMTVTEYAARSFRVNGFRDIVLIGDSGGNQKGLQAVAGMLNKEWAKSGVRVHYVPDYYSGDRFDAWLKRQGESPRDIGAHAGISDTSQLMAVAPSLIRAGKLAPGGDSRTTGVSGNPARASAAYGRKGLEIKIEAAVAQIRKQIAARGILK